MAVASGWGSSGDLCPALKCAPVDTWFGLLIVKMIDEAVPFNLALNSQIPLNCAFLKSVQLLLHYPLGIVQKEAMLLLCGSFVCLK